MTTDEQASRIRRAAQHLGFEAESAAEKGTILTLLAGTKPGGDILELGTGAGLGTVHLLAGMDSTARCTSVELDPDLSAVAASVLGDDPRLTLVIDDGEHWLAQNIGKVFDLVYADTWPGKYHALDAALDMVKPGGLYLVDDLLPQTNWPDGHQARVDELVRTLERLPGWHFTRVDAASGLMLGTRLGEQSRPRTPAASTTTPGSSPRGSSRWRRARLGTGL